MNAKEILLWSQVSGLTVELEIENRIFQISGRNDMVGYWERFFPKGDHPYRRTISEKDMNAMIAAGQTFLVYEIWRDQAEVLTKAELETKIKQTFLTGE